jgi:hypothetical protein
VRRNNAKVGAELRAAMSPGWTRTPRLRGIFYRDLLKLQRDWVSGFRGFIPDHRIKVRMELGLGTLSLPPVQSGLVRNDPAFRWLIEFKSDEADILVHGPVGPADFCNE